MLYPRAYAAVALIGLAFVLVLAGDWVRSSLAGNDAAQDSAGSPSMMGAGVLGFDQDGIRINGDALLASFSEEAPSSFKEEVLSWDGGRYSVDEEGVIADFSFVGDVESAMKSAELWLADKGWKAVPSGQESFETFAKAQGEFRWLAVSCSSATGVTSVVVNARKETNAGGE